MNLKIKILLSLSYVFFLMMVMFVVSACSDSFTDERDGQSYDMVQIGDQVWMAENLNFAGTDLATFCPDGDDRNCKKYGRLYTWESAQKACPAGWRLPTRDDFMKLIAVADPVNVQSESNSIHSTATSDQSAPNIAGAALKSTSGWYKKGNGTDAVHFNALPAGYMVAVENSSGQPDASSGQPEASGIKLAAGKFDGIGGYAHIWSVTPDESESAFAYYFFLDFSSSTARLSSFSATDARSVRCIKN